MPEPSAQAGGLARGRVVAAVASSSPQCRTRAFVQMRKCMSTFRALPNRLAFFEMGRGAAELATSKAHIPGCQQAAQLEDCCIILFFLCFFFSSCLFLSVSRKERPAQPLQRTPPSANTIQDHNNDSCDARA